MSVTAEAELAQCVVSVMQLGQVLIELRPVVPDGLSA
jgi:hypothetical protein